METSRLSALYTLITWVWMGFTIQIISAVFPAMVITAKFGKLSTKFSLRMATKKAGPLLACLK
jgi:putative Ca2+/H+ antiporter (TMEM165/GDT1 family)